MVVHARRRWLRLPMTLAVVLAAAVVVVMGAGWLSSASAQEDEFEGLPPGKGQEDVYYNCTACHSIRLVTQQGMSRKRWADTLVWMVEEQGMPELDQETLDIILDYLAEHYGPQRPDDETLSPYRQLQPLSPTWQ